MLVRFRLGSETPHTTQEVLAGVSRELWPPATAGFDGAVRALSFQLERLRVASEAQAEATSENTAAVVENTLAQANRRESGVASVSGAVAGFLGAGLGLSPLITGLVRLFKGEEPGRTPTLVKYVQPPSLHIEGWVERGTAPRIRPPARSDVGRDPWGGALTGRETFAPPVEVTVQVQAIDSRSFLDHSWEIARAVREAMLQSHALNDVVNEL